jgi:hypothetical protein
LSIFFSVSKFEVSLFLSDIYIYFLGLRFLCTCSATREWVVLVDLKLIFFQDFLPELKNSPRSSSTSSFSFQRNENCKVQQRERERERELVWRWRWRKGIMAQKKKIKINNRPRQKVFRLCKLFFLPFSLSLCILVTLKLRIACANCESFFVQFCYCKLQRMMKWVFWSSSKKKCMHVHIRGYCFQFLSSPLLKAANWLLSWMLAGKEGRGYSQFEWAVGFIRSQSTLCYCRWQLFFQVSLLYASSNPSWP